VTGRVCAIRRPRRLLVLLSLMLSSCARHDDASPTPTAPRPGDEARLSVSTADAQAADASGPDTSAGVEKRKATTSWIEDTRRQHWSDARAKLDALPETDKKLAEIRYVRARVALAVGDGAVAAQQLDGLDGSLPLLAADIAHYLAEAHLQAGPYDKAGDYFSSRGTPSAWLRAATAYERHQDLARALWQCERVIGYSHKTRLEEAEARACKLRLETGPDDHGFHAANARWISVHAPDTAWVKDADQALSRLAPSHPLTGAELMTRAQVLADAGRVDDALKVLDRIGGAPGPRVARSAELRTRGDILYKTRGRALEAARILEECAALGGPHATEDSFHAARALARADHDDDAAYRMLMLAKNHPGTHWGDEAQFYVGYLALIHGKWKEAAAAFDEYARAYPKGVERRDATRGGGLAHLMNDDYAIARRLFEEVAAEESDALAAGRALSLAALASLRDGDRLHAIAEWSQVIRAHPLSWPALVARARLAEAKAAVPPLVDAATGNAPPPLDVKLPPPVDLLHRVGLDGDAEAALHEREGVVAGAAPAGRGLEALCDAYGAIGRAKRRFQLIGQIPVNLLMTAPGPANRWAWECAYAEPFADDVAEDTATDAAKPTGSIDEDALAYAVMRQESNYDPDALSPAHAVGLMQLLPETARAIATARAIPYDEANLTQPSLNVALGVRYLRDLAAKFPRQLPLAIAAYNAGDDAITRWLTRSPKMDIDEFVERIPYPETRGYVGRVMGNWAHYEYLKHGEAGVPPLNLALSTN